MVGGGVESSDDEPQLTVSITTAQAAASVLNRNGCLIAAPYWAPGSGVSRYGNVALNNASLVLVPLSV